MNEPQKPVETKAERFVRIAERRMEKTLKEIELIGNLSNVGSYEFSKEQSEAMFAAIDDAVSKAQALFDQAFNGKPTKPAPSFSFRKPEAEGAAA